MAVQVFSTLDAAPGLGSGQIVQVLPHRRSAFFTILVDPLHTDVQLWSSDGTPSGTHALPAPNGPLRIEGPVSTEADAFFIVGSAADMTLWASSTVLRGIS